MHSLFVKQIWSVLFTSLTILTAVLETAPHLQWLTWWKYETRIIEQWRKPGDFSNLALQWEPVGWLAKTSSSWWKHCNFMMYGSIECFDSVEELKKRTESLKLYKVPKKLSLIFNKDWLQWLIEWHQIQRLDKYWLNHWLFKIIIKNANGLLGL